MLSKMFPEKWGGSNSPGQFRFLKRQRAFKILLTALLIATPLSLSAQVEKDTPMTHSDCWNQKKYSVTPPRGLRYISTGEVMVEWSSPTPYVCWYKPYYYDKNGGRRQLGGQYQLCPAGQPGEITSWIAYAPPNSVHGWGVVIRTIPELKSPVAVDEKDQDCLGYSPTPYPPQSQ